MRKFGKYGRHQRAHELRVVPGGEQFALEGAGEKHAAQQSGPGFLAMVGDGRQKGLDADAAQSFAAPAPDYILCRRIMGGQNGNKLLGGCNNPRK